MEKLDLNALGVVEMTQEEMILVDGGNIFVDAWNAIKDAAEAVWDAVCDFLKENTDDIVKALIIVAGTEGLKRIL
jgi:hypothetical protein